MCELVIQRLVSRLTEIVRTMQRFSHIFPTRFKGKVVWDGSRGWLARRMCRPKRLTTWIDDSSGKAS